MERVEVQIIGQSFMRNRTGLGKCTSFISLLACDGHLGSAALTRRDEYLMMGGQLPAGAEWEQTAPHGLLCLSPRSRAQLYLPPASDYGRN